MYANHDDRTGLDEAAAAAAEADLVILAVGEHGFMSGEARSRTDLGLPGLQQELFDAVVAANPNVVTVLYHGRPLAIPTVAARSRALLAAWQPGTQGGHALADVLFGKRAPGGRLPIGFPRAVGQCPLTYRRLPTGRPAELPGDSVWWSHYEDAPNAALFPFGFGLGYTRFTLTDLRLSPKRLPHAQLVGGSGFRVSGTLRNVGPRAGSEVVQVYVQDPVAKRARPVRELKASRKVHLEPGAETEVSFELGEAAFAYWTAEESWHVEPGAFVVHVGVSSVDTEALAVEVGV